MRGLCAELPGRGHQIGVNPLGCFCGRARRHALFYFNDGSRDCMSGIPVVYSQRRGLSFPIEGGERHPGIGRRRQVRRRLFLGSIGIGVKGILCEGRDVSQSVDLARLASVVEDVPTLPSVMFEVLAIAEDENSTAGDLEAVIMRDQALSAKVLKVANSAYYGIPRTVETVSRATVLLGFQTVVGLALTVSVYDTLWGAGKGHYLDRRDIWKHSLSTATAARLLAGDSNGKQGAVAFTAGMLHDIGKSVFDTYLPEEYSKVIDACHRDSLQMHDAEQTILGVTHGDLGYRVGLRWQLPDVLCQSIRCHHALQSAEADFRRTAGLVNLGDFLTRHCGIGEPPDMTLPGLDQDALKVWGGTEHQLKDVVTQLEKHREQIESFQP